MPSLRDIRDRITSINNTSKITRAMKMVAAAKVKKSENKTKAGRPFTRELAMAFARVLASLGEAPLSDVKVEKALENYPVLLKKREMKTAGLLVITSNKGLAGAYNANVIRFALKRIEEYKQQGINCKLFVVGQKGYSALNRKASQYGYEILKSYTKFPQDPTSGAAIVIAEDMAEYFVSGHIDCIELFTTSFKNMMSYNVVDWKLLPLDEQIVKEEARHNGTHIDAKMIFEPSLHSILQRIVPMFISNAIYHALLEATASELASRMTAMSAACKNADEMIQILTIDYNKARQATITQELSEIVSGADALKK